MGIARGTVRYKDTYSQRTLRLPDLHRRGGLTQLVLRSPESPAVLVSHSSINRAHSTSGIFVEDAVAFKSGFRSIASVVGQVPIGAGLAAATWLTGSKT